jgi:pimeloyl-ACP methyl ester carboxylesterase
VVTLAAKGKSLNNVILTHGLNNNKDEDGYFVKMSDLLSSADYNVLRFDFRGHGESKVKSEDMTVTGELWDLEASVSYLGRLTSDRADVMFVASSFGAPSVILYSSTHQNKVKKIALWNPVLDFKRTFLQRWNGGRLSLMIMDTGSSIPRDTLRFRRQTSG